MAESWFAKSARHGSPDGEYAIGELYSVDNRHAHNLPKAIKLLRRSSHAGYIPAMYLLGGLLANHPEIARKHRDEAIRNLTRAAEAGVWEASAELGILARDGVGVPRDIREAFRWFVIETKQGGREVEERTRQDLALCRQALPADQQNQELRAAEAWLQQHNESDIYVLSDGTTIPAGTSYRAEPASTTTSAQ